MNPVSSPARFAGAALAATAVVGLAACGGGTSTAKTPASSTTAKTSSAAATSSTPTPATTTSTSTTPSTASNATHRVAVSLSEFKIKPATPSVAAGRVEFVVTNSGHMKHQFTVIHTSKSAATVLSKAKPNDDIPGAKGEISAIHPGTTKKLIIKDLKPGHYALVCALPGHYQSGMYADFTVN